MKKFATAIALATCALAANAGVVVGTSYEQSDLDGVTIKEYSVNGTLPVNQGAFGVEGKAFRADNDAAFNSLEGSYTWMPKVSYGFKPSLKGFVGVAHDISNADDAAFGGVDVGMRYQLTPAVSASGNLKVTRPFESQDDFLKQEKGTLGVEYSLNQKKTSVGAGLTYTNYRGIDNSSKGVIIDLKHQF